MLYHYAVTPDCFDVSKERGVGHPVESVVRALLSMERNGVLADYHSGEWQETIF